MIPSLVALALSGCSTSAEPAWALDPIWLEPSVDDGIYGFQTWELFREGWDRKQKDRFFLCAVVVELEGTPITCEAEPGCAHAWEVTPAVLESDCVQATAQDPLFTSLERLALGGLDGGEEVPHPGLTSTGWADYGYGWEQHGHAYPEALDHGGGATSPTWDGTQTFQLLPTLAFPLADGG